MTRAAHIKTDEEARDWIDSQKVLTKNELNHYVYGYKLNGSSKINRLWLYAIKTKNLKEMREYRDKKLATGAVKKDNLPKFTELVKKDKRVLMKGGRKRLLDFGLKISERTYTNLKKRYLCCRETQ